MIVRDRDGDGTAAPEAPPSTEPLSPGVCIAVPDDADGSAAAPQPAPPPRQRPLALVALVFALVFWSSAFAAISQALRSYTPARLAFFRFLVASIALALYTLVKPVRMPRRGDLLVIAVAAFFGITFYQVSLSYAQVKVSSGVAGLLIGTSPVFAALLAVLVLRERLGLRGWAGTAISFVGAAFITLAANGGGLRALTHLEFQDRAGWVLLSAIAGAVYTVMQKPMLRRYTALEFTSYAVWAGTAFMLPLLPGLFGEIKRAHAVDTWAVVYLGLFPAAVAYVTWAEVVSRMSVSRAVSFLYLVPALAVVFGWLLRDESFSAGALVGGALVIGGVVLVNSRAKRVVEMRPPRRGDAETAAEGRREI